MNVSSVVIKTRPQNLTSVIESINGIIQCEVHFYDTEGRIVLIVESDSDNEQIGKMKLLQDLPMVLSMNLMYTYCGDDSIGEQDKNSGRDNSLRGFNH